MADVNCLRCRFRHEDNGNCTAVGGFCTAVPAAHCPLLREYLDTGMTPEEVLPKDKADEIALKLMCLADLESLCSYTRLRELAEADDLLASGYETGRYEPLGLFLVGEAGGTWTGIDNSTGHAWTEEFGTQAECLKWLKGENTVFTLDEAVSRIYELSAEAHMNIARNLKERRAWCEKHLKNYQTIKRAFEKVLDIRYAERLEVYRYYYGEREAVRHG